MIWTRVAALASASLILTGCVGVIPLMSEGAPHTRPIPTEPTPIPGPNPEPVPIPEPEPEPLWPTLPQKPTEDALCPEPPDKEISLRGDGADAEHGWQQEAEGIMAVVSAYAQQLIGFEEDYAQSCVAETDFGWRITERDGVAFPVTMDYRMDRINVVVRGGVVVETSIG